MNRAAKKSWSLFVLVTILVSVVSAQTHRLEIPRYDLSLVFPAPYQDLGDSAYKATTTSTIGEGTDLAVQEVTYAFELTPREVDLEKKLALYLFQSMKLDEIDRLTESGYEVVAEELTTFGGRPGFEVLGRKGNEEFLVRSQWCNERAIVWLYVISTNADSKQLSGPFFDSFEDQR